MESLWEQTSGHTGFCHLEQDAKTDVLIIGVTMPNSLMLSANSDSVSSSAT